LFCHRYNLTAAKQVTLLQSQTENPYWDKDVVGTPACEAHAMVIKDSENITFHGTLADMTVAETNK
jgi:hypothetical protein